MCRTYSILNRIKFTCDICVVAPCRQQWIWIAIDTLALLCHLLLHLRSLFSIFFFNFNLWNFETKRNRKLLLSHLRPANGNVVRQFSWKFSRRQVLWDHSFASIKIENDWYRLRIGEIYENEKRLHFSFSSLTHCVLCATWKYSYTIRMEWIFLVRCAPLWWTGRFRCSIAMGMPFSLYSPPVETSKLICLLNINETYCLRLSAAVWTSGHNSEPSEV